LTRIRTTTCWMLTAGWSPRTKIKFLITADDVITRGGCPQAGNVTPCQALSTGWAENGTRIYRGCAELWQGPRVHAHCSGSVATGAVPQWVGSNKQTPGPKRVNGLDPQELMQRGVGLLTQCAACHQDNGSGLARPPASAQRSSTGPLSEHIRCSTDDPGPHAGFCGPALRI
jgi:hypothetical protein